VNYYLQTCRFCGKQDHQGSITMVKYGVRHHACHACYLDAGKSLTDLHTWQIGTFPFRLIKDRGMLAEVERLTSGGK
jgi:hypothetical protein